MSLIYGIETVKVYVLSGAIAFVTMISIPTANWIFGAGKVHRDFEQTKENIKTLSQDIKESNDKQVKFNTDMNNRLIRIETILNHRLPMSKAEKQEKELSENKYEQL